VSSCDVDPTGHHDAPSVTGPCQHLAVNPRFDPAESWAYFAMTSRAFFTGHPLLEVAELPLPALELLVHRPMGTQD
jgi:hypothetical protein